MDLKTLLQDRFSHPGFRPGQRSICAHVAGGKDALVVMPTMVVLIHGWWLRRQGAPAPG